MPKPNYIELDRTCRIPILFEDRSIIAIDKPERWMLVPLSWQRTNWNLQAAIMSSMAAGHFWARSRNLKFLKYVHRLDAETTGILLFAKSQGALDTFGELFETRRMQKIYLAVSDRAPKEPSWNCRLSLAQDKDTFGRMLPDEEGKPSETDFKLLSSVNGRHLIEAHPFSGRQHQIRVHLAESGCPIVGDPLYGKPGEQLALRAISLAYQDPFTRRPVLIQAPVEDFLKRWGFPPQAYQHPAPPRRPAPPKAAPAKTAPPKPPRA